MSRAPIAQEWKKFKKNKKHREKITETQREKEIIDTVLKELPPPHEGILQAIEQKLTKDTGEELEK